MLSHQRVWAHLQQQLEVDMVVGQVVALFPPLRNGGAVEDHHVEE